MNRFKIFTMLCLLSLVAACGGGSGGDEPTDSNSNEVQSNWDRMKWGEGRWQ